MHGESQPNAWIPERGSCKVSYVKSVQISLMPYVSPMTRVYMKSKAYGYRPTRRR
jgi:hypothetical protein